MTSEITSKSVAGAISLIQDIATGRIEYKVNESRKDVFNTSENDWIVDTCKAFDSGKWETGIKKPKTENYTITEQYENREEAQKGHERWVALMRENPNRELPDINVWETMDEDDY